MINEVVQTAADSQDQLLSWTVVSLCHKRVKRAEEFAEAEQRNAAGGGERVEVTSVSVVCPQSPDELI